MRSLLAFGALTALGCTRGGPKWVDSRPPEAGAPSASPSAVAEVESPRPPVPAELLPDGRGLEVFSRAPAGVALRPVPDASKVLRRALAQTLAGELAGVAPPGAKPGGAGDAPPGARSGDASEVLGAELAEGHVASVKVTLAPGSCLTVGAHGGVGVLETDLFVTKPGKRSDLLGEDTARGPGAVVGGRAGCLRNGSAGPLEVEVWVGARTGSGLVLVRIVKSGG